MLPDSVLYGDLPLHLILILSLSLCLSCVQSSPPVISLPLCIVATVHLHLIHSLYSLAPQYLYSTLPPYLGSPFFFQFFFFSFLCYFHFNHLYLVHSLGLSFVLAVTNFPSLSRLDLSVSCVCVCVSFVRLCARQCARYHLTSIRRLSKPHHPTALRNHSSTSPSSTSKTVRLNRRSQ